MPLLPFGELDARLERVIHVVPESDHERIALAGVDLSHRDNRLRAIEQRLAEFAEIVSAIGLVSSHAATSSTPSRIARACSVIRSFVSRCHG